MKPAVLLIAVALGFAAEAVAQPVVIVVRHAERADGGAGAMTMAADPGLSPAGRQRAAVLAAMLKDARLSAIYVTEYKRTRETADPVAGSSGLAVAAIPAKDLDGLIEAVKTARGNVLVVGHSNTVPDILRGLGVTERVTIGDAEYDNLFIVVRGSQPVLIRLRFD